MRDKDRAPSGLAGRLWPPVSAIHTSPPMRRAIWRVSASPMPRPPGTAPAALVVTPSAKTASGSVTEIPGPESATEMITAVPSAITSTSTTPGSSLSTGRSAAASIALSIRLPNTVVTTTGSVSTPSTQVCSPSRRTTRRSRA